MNLVNFYYTLLKACNIPSEDLELRDAANILVAQRNNVNEIPTWRQLTAKAIKKYKSDNPVWARVGEALEVGVSVYSLTEHLALEYCNAFPEALQDLDETVYMNILSMLIRDVSLHNDATAVLWRLSKGREEGVPNDVDVCFMEFKEQLCYRFGTFDKFLPAVMKGTITTPEEANHIVSELFNDDKYELIGKALTDRSTLIQHNHALVRWVLHSIKPITIVKNKLLTAERLKHYMLGSFNNLADTAEKKYWLNAVLRTENLNYMNAVRNVASSEYIYTVKETLKHCEIDSELLECDFVILQDYTEDRGENPSELQQAAVMSKNAVKAVSEVVTVIMSHYNESAKMDANMSVTEMCALCYNTLMRGNDDLSASLASVDGRDIWKTFVSLHYALHKQKLWDAFSMGEFEGMYSNLKWMQLISGVVNITGDIASYLLNPEEAIKPSEVAVYFESLDEEHKKEFRKLLGYIYVACVVGDDSIENYGYTLEEVRKLITP